MINGGGQGGSRKRRPTNTADCPDIVSIRTPEIRSGIEQLRTRLKAEDFFALKPKDLWIHLLRDRRHVFHGRRYGHNGLHAPDPSQATLLSTLLAEAKKRPFDITPNSMTGAIIVEAARLNQELGPQQAALILRSANALLESAADAAAAKRRLDAALRFLAAAGGIEPAVQALAAAAAVAAVTAVRR